MKILPGQFGIDFEECWFSTLIRVVFGPSSADGWAITGIFLGAGPSISKDHKALFTQESQYGIPCHGIRLLRSVKREMSTIARLMQLFVFSAPGWSQAFS